MTTISKERRDAIRAAAEKATPGPWGVWTEPTPSKDRAIDELAYQVMSTPDADFAEAVYLLDAAGKCPATTGCGPTSAANATHIANCDPQTILALLDALDAAEKAEPVAWMVVHPTEGISFELNDDHSEPLTPADADAGYTAVPLYTRPPATREGWQLLTENVVGPVLVCRLGDTDHNWLPLTAYRVTGGKWERPASRDGLPYEPTHWQRLPTAAPEAK